MSVLELTGRLRRYDWGSTTAIQTMLGDDIDGRPAAELWFGAHPDDPSGVPGLGRTLDAVIADDPVTALGAGSMARFGPGLPFLLKVLAAEKALSIQVHPDLEQARTGFAAEDAAGIAHDARERNYRDANHKPELVCALTEFEGVCGFRSPAEILATLDDLALPELDFLARLLHGPDPLRAAFTALLHRPDPSALVDALLGRLAGMDQHDPVARAVRLAAADFPRDVGTVLLILLRHVRLQPGEAMFLDAGTVHCYLRGTAVEILAASDNVLRCGLTSKHIDVDELLRITTFAAGPDARVTPTPDGSFVVAVPDFRLQRLDAPSQLAGAGPRIVLCTVGEVQLDGVRLTPGHAAFVPAGAAAELTGKGRAYVGSVGS